MSVFEKADFDARVRAAKERMLARGMDVLIATDPSNMHYLTGYDGWSFYVPQMVVVAQDLDEPLWIGRGIDANGAHATTFLPEANVVSYSDRYVQASDCHPMDVAADALRARKLDGGVIGVEMDGYYFSPRGYHALQEGLPNARFADATGLVNWVRAVKSEKELAVMHQAARILERVMDTAFRAIEPGVRQCDAAAEIMRAQVQGTAENGGDYPAIVPMLPSGPGTATPHLTWSDAPFRKDELTVMELAGCRLRYHAPMSRTLFLGEPPRVMTDTAAIVEEGIAAALETAKPGKTCADVEHAWRTTIARHGLEKESRVGYPIGLSYPPDWGERTMSLRPGDTTELQPGMCFHFMPGIWQDDWGIEISEPFRVTEHGAEKFAEVPRALRKAV